MKFEFNWPSGFRGEDVENVDGRTTDARVIGILIAHLGAFGSGELKNEQIKGLISNMWLFVCYTIQLITIKLCTKFQNPNPSS